MKRSVLAALMLVVLCMVPTSLHAYTNEQDGFRMLPWGTPLKVLGDTMTVIKTEENGALVITNRKGEKMTLGSVELSAVDYAFWDGKFLMVKIEAMGKQNFSKLIDITEGQYGTPTNTNQYNGTRNWLGNKTFITLEYNNKLDKSVINMTSISLLSQMINSMKKTAASEAAKDF